MEDQDLTSSPTMLAGYATQESPQTQISNVYAMMWPNANPGEVDFMMQDGAWSSFLPNISETTPLDGGTAEQLRWDYT